MRREFESEGERLGVDATPLGDGRFRVTVGDVVSEVDAVRLPDGSIRIAFDGESHRPAIQARVAAHQSGGAHVRLPGRTVVLKKWESRRGGGGDAASDGAIKSPMTGTLLSVAVAVGDEVEAGQTVATLSAMKMETKLVAPFAGKITEVGAAAGDTVQDGQLLVQVEASEVDE